MISPDRQLLQQQIYNFLRTVTIKYDPIAQYINESLLHKGYQVNFEDPTTWKYYLNMQGRYHLSDTPMYVTSLDTRQSILFSPETLNDNLRTRSIYLPGGAYYNRLCSLYPDQVDLIKSILFPVTDINKAIMADDLTLLHYGQGYLEPTEESVLITDIEKFLTIYKERWYFSFLSDEPYFYITVWSSLWVQLAMLLMSSRMAHIKTAFVHSWDVWNELEAHGLDNYSDILDREKAMMLYQNIDYFKANAGKQSNLTILANRLLTSFGIALYGRSVLQESETGALNYQLTPQLVPVRIPKHAEALSTRIQIKSVQEIQSEIYSKGLTSSDSRETVLAVERQLGDTTLNEFATKFMEIRPIVQIKRYAEILNMFLMETLIVSINQGYYAKPIEVFDPLTDDPIYLPPKELLALYNYATLKSMGISTNEFPTKVRLYKSFLPEIGKPSTTIPYFDTKLYLSQVVNSEAYLKDLTYDQHLQTPLEFSNNVTRLFLRYMEHLLADEDTSLDKAHHAYAYLTSLCHTRRDESIELISGYKTYGEWLGAGGIDLFALTLSQYEIQSNPREQWGNLADAIITALIPINDTLKFFGNFTLSNSGYDRLRKLFVQLTSYHLVFIESDRDTAEFSIGAKWSTLYGPDDVHTFGDSTTMFHVHTQDKTFLSSDLESHSGVTIHRDTKMIHPVNYNVTSTDVIVHDNTLNYVDLPRLLSTTKGISMSHGSLYLGYNPPLPLIVNP